MSTQNSFKMVYYIMSEPSLRYKPDTFSVRIGSNKAVSGGQQMTVAKVFWHEQFNISYPYDVAVLKTKTAMKLNKSAKPIKLADSVPEAGTDVQVIGFGDSYVSVR